MSERLVIVTGAGKGIGFDIAGAFLEMDDVVILIGRNEENLKAAQIALEKRALQSDYFVLNVADEKDVREFAEKFARRFKHLDVLVNNVGNFIFKKSVDYSYREWRDIVDSNLTSTFLMIKYLKTMLSRSLHPRIINIGVSYASKQTGQPCFGPYAAAKAAVISLTKTMAVELAEDKITVNAVSPGMIDTGVYSKEIIKKYSKLIPAGRFGSPGEVARAVLFLASNKSDYITGTEIILDGGWNGEIPDVTV